MNLKARLATGSRVQLPTNLLDELGLERISWDVEAIFLTRLDQVHSPANEAQATSGAARYLVFRLLHRTITFGLPADPELDAVIKTHVLSLPLEDSERAHLRDLVAYAELSADFWVPVLPMGLITFAEELEREGLYREALAFMGLACLSYGEKMPAAVFVHVAQVTGRVHRRLAQWDKAEKAYRGSERVALELGDAAAVGRAMNGRVMVLMGRGDLPAAAELAETAIASLQAPALEQVQAVAYQMLATVREHQNRPAEAVRALYTSYGLQTSPQERLQVLGDLGACLARLRLFGPARDALTVVARTSERWAIRTNAMIELMALEGEESHELAFRNLDRELRKLHPHMPPSLAVDYLVQSARGHNHFGYSGFAARLLRQALADAERHRLSQWIFQIEALLQAGSREGERRPATTVEELPAVADVVAELRTLADGCYFPLLPP